MAPLVRSVPMDPFYQVQIVCEAYGFAGPTAWAAFQQALQPWSTLSADAASVLADPTGCPVARAAPAPADPTCHLDPTGACVGGAV